MVRVWLGQGLGVCMFRVCVNASSGCGASSCACGACQLVVRGVRSCDAISRECLRRAENTLKPIDSLSNLRCTNSMSWFTTRGSHSSTPIDRNTLITTAASRGMRRSADAIARRGERA